ncbi:MAG: di-trans,poly-cis-decaprenylcistransferase [Acidimicrobiia bacterium]|nr:di-trans,poly-cis-decaprenylcistransferase [Acidimicrobiia bacterium]
MAVLTLGELAVRFGLTLRGDPERAVDTVGTLAAASPRAIAFLANPRLATALARTGAAAVILREESLADIVRAASKREVSYLTVFGFSTENWVRPRAEVRHILGLHKKLFGRISELNENNVRVNWIGRPFDEPGSRTPLYVQRAIRKAIEDTKQNSGMVLTVAFDYGSRSELTRAAKMLVASNSELTPANLQNFLYDASLPPVDVLVRTSGESRISNFLLWQINAAKIYFTERPWPDFDAVDLDAAIALTKN